MSRYAIWYMKPEWFPKGVFGEKPDPKNLEATHVLLHEQYTVNDENDPRDTVFCELQGEVWSPNGEARGLISSKGLQHTSMSVGDVMVDSDGGVHMVDLVGFTTL